MNMNSANRDGNEIKEHEGGVSEDERLKQNMRSVKVSVFLIRLIFSAQVVFFIFYYFLSAIYSLLFPSYVWWSGLYLLSIGALVIIVGVYLGWKRAEHRLVILPLIALSYWTVDLVWSKFLKNYKTLMVFADLALLSLIIALLSLFAAIISLTHLIIITNARIKQRKYQQELQKKLLNKTGEKGDERVKVSSYERFWTIKRTLKTMRIGFKNAPYKHIIIMILLIFTSSLTYLFETEGFGASSAFGYVTINPRDTNLDFAFWASINPDKYTDAQKEAMDKYGIMIITYDNPNILENYPINEQRWVNSCVYWRDNYPNVRIMAVAMGYPGGFAWDGGTAGTIALMKQFINVTLENNLTNVVGINTDQESPQGMDFHDTFRNRSRNEMANQMWKDFFEWANSTLPPGRFEFQTTFGGGLMLDPYDKDNDLEVFERNNILSVPYWDEYAPMYYMTGGSNKEEGVLDGDTANYKLYEWMGMLKESLTRAGLEDRIGVYIGITNMSIFSRDNQVRANGKIISGFDELILQGLIAKSFGIKRLTTFILDTVPSSHHNTFMGGVFDSYGDDFLDRYNESLNGINSSNSFKIPIIPNNDFDGALTSDIILDRGLTEIIFVVIVYSWVISYKRTFKKRD
ncbi:MAG: hypothetical protein ACTSU2_12090 [Promethearchaeota archaeon]